MARVTAFTGRGARVAAGGKGVGGLDDDSLLDSIRCSGALGILHGNEAEGAVALGGIPEDPLEIGAGDDLADDDLLTVFQGHQAVGTASVLAADGGDADERRSFIGVVAIEDVSADGLVLVSAIVQRAGIGWIGSASAPHIAGATRATCIAGSTSTTDTSSRPRAARIARTRGTTGGIGATRSTGTACGASTARSVRAVSCIGTARVARTSGTTSGIGTTCSTGATRSVGTTCGTGAACSVGTSRSTRTVRGARITTSADAASACTRARSRAGAGSCSCTGIGARTCACTAARLFAATVSLCVTVSNRSLLPPSAGGEGGRSSRIRRAATTTTAATQGGSKGHGAQDGTCRQQGA